MGKFEVWNLSEDVGKYQNYIDKLSYVTPYHFSEYLLAESVAEDGETKIFLYEEEDKFAIYPCVIRRIRQLTYMKNLQDELYDAIAPHEYGGMLTNVSTLDMMMQLHINFLEYCRKENVIHHFIRINPYLNELPKVYESMEGEIIHSNQQVYVDLTKEEEEIWAEYKSNVRRNIKRGKKSGLLFEIAEKNMENVHVFQQMYTTAMDILQAKKFLYFNAEYYRRLVECNCSRLCFVKNADGKVVAASIILLSDQVVYYHLGCFDRQYSLQRPMNYLMHSMILWSKKHNYSIFHLAGGGKSLLQFKEGFSQTRIPYYILNQITDSEKYQCACDLWKKQYPEHAEEVFYPLYRMEE